MKRTILAFCALGALASACLLPTVDGFAGGAGSVDAGSDRTGTTDAASSDAASPFDCNGAAFCAKFDTSSDPTLGWTGQFLSPGASIAVDKTRSTSAPGALLAHTPAAGPNDYLAAALYTEIQRSSAAGARLRFAARVATLDPARAVSLGQLGIVTDVTNSSFVRIWMSGGTMDLAEEGRVGDNLIVDVHHVVAAPWPIDEWMVLEIEVNAGTRDAKLRRDGTLVTTIALAPPGPARSSTWTWASSTRRRCRRGTPS
jgi:hypothetical protein